MSIPIPVPPGFYWRGSASCPYGPRKGLPALQPDPSLVRTEAGLIEPECGWAGRFVGAHDSRRRRAWTVRVVGVLAIPSGLHVMPSWRWSMVVPPRSGAGRRSAAPSARASAVRACRRLRARLRHGTVPRPRRSRRSSETAHRGGAGCRRSRLSAGACRACGCRCGGWRRRWSAYRALVALVDLEPAVETVEVALDVTRPQKCGTRNSAVEAAGSSRQR